MSENIRPLESDSLEVQRSTLFTPSLEVLAIGTWGVNFKKFFREIKYTNSNLEFDFTKKVI